MDEKEIKMTVLDMVKKYLEENEFDGLFLGAQCACKKDDLSPCGTMNEMCAAGYLQPNSPRDDEMCGEFDFVIGAEKPTPNVNF